MKKLLYTIVLSLIGLTVYSQTWSAGSGILFTNPTTTRVGVGITPTLYAIEQQKLIEELQQRLSEVENRKGGK